MGVAGVAADLELPHRRFVGVVADPDSGDELRESALRDPHASEVDLPPLCRPMRGASPAHHELRTLRDDLRRHFDEFIVGLHQQSLIPPPLRQRAYRVSWLAPLLSVELDVQVPLGMQLLLLPWRHRLVEKAAERSVYYLSS